MGRRNRIILNQVNFLESGGGRAAHAALDEADRPES
jgi:hypothetical protein